jgi:tRNA-uridine 2-sulfurtransferase
VQGHDHPSLYTDRVNAVDLSWVSGSAPHCNWVYTAKTRYRQKDTPCAIVSADGGRCVVEFAEPQWAVTPGQSIVVYESQVCLGGGVIESSQRSGDAELRNEICPPNSVDARDEFGGMRAKE